MSKINEYKKDLELIEKLKNEGVKNPELFIDGVWMNEEKLTKILKKKLKKE